MYQHARVWSRIALAAGIVVAGVIVGVGPEGVSLEPRDAHAIIGRPLTPMSYAGVARRTVRRTAYAGAVVGGAYAAGAYGAGRVAVLPAGCVYGVGLYTCGAVRYRPMYEGPNVVYVAQ